METPLETCDQRASEMRPRWLYLTIFIWTAVSGGRFTAPFLESEASMSDTYIGFALALQLGLIIVFSSPAGLLADALEKKCKHTGRSYVLSMGIGMGTLALLLQIVVRDWFAAGLADGGSVGYSKSSKSMHLWSFFLRIIYALGYAMVEPVLDGLTLSYLKDEGNDQADFGKERLFGAIGWAIGNSAMGRAIDIWGFKAMYLCNMVAASLSFLAICAFAQFEKTKLTVERTALQCQGATVRFNGCKNIQNEAADETSPLLLQTTTETECCSFLTTECSPPKEFFAEGMEKNNYTYKSPKTESEEQAVLHETVKISLSAQLLKIIEVLFASRYGAGFLFAYTLLSLGGAVVENMVFLFYEFLGTSYTVCGLSVIVTVLFELPIFHLAPKFLEKIGPYKMMQIAITAFIVRVTSYTFVPEGRFGLLLLVESLHGVSFAFYKTSGVEFVAEVCPKGSEATGQGVLNALRGLGSVLGLTFAGWAEERFGPRSMYRGLAVINFFAIVALAFTEQFKPAVTTSNVTRQSPSTLP